jgi:capsule polysaccharide export protein KpsE/RkpR
MSNKDEISFRKLINQTELYIRFLLSKWLIIVIVGVIGGAIGLIYAYTSKPTYTATLNFVLSNGSSSSGGLMGFASQFGLNLNSSDDDVFSGDNIITLMKSRRMVQEALFLPLPQSNQSLLNFYIKDNEIDKGWAQNEKFKNAYPFPAVANNMSLIQDSLFRGIYNSILKNMLNVFKPDKDQNIYAVATTSNSQAFSYYLTKYLVNETSAFYIDTKTSSAKKNLVMLQLEADSLRGVLSSAIVSAGSQADLTFNLNPAYQVKRSGIQENQARAAALGQAYGQVLQSLEIAKITLQKETPLYQIIDEPTLPLYQEKPGKLTSLIVGGFLGGFLILAFLIMRKAYADFKTDKH